MSGSELPLVALVIGIALLFDFTNGAHDAANSIATVVSTRVLTLWQALILAAFFNTIAFLVFGLAVAKTVGKGLVDLHMVTPEVILAALVGAIAWNLLTLFLGLPTSSSHALVGGYAGAAIAHAGFAAILWSGWTLTLIFIVLAPLIGGILGAALMFLMKWMLFFVRANPRRVDTWSRRIQLLSASLYSLSHGSNDAQKTVGIITGLLVSAHYLPAFVPPVWVILISYSAIGLGTLIGGRRIIRTMGQKIYKLRTLDGVCAETAGAASIFIATYLGVPVSTTHVITGAISGVGAIQRTSSVRWHIAARVVWAWVCTIPAAAALGFVLFRAGFMFS
ncbi:MAG: inorganic phosphate transporter [Candidatus Sungbacteria bacterium]|uniref:Inorganic phosphate transporter n=1 Tax=Candidatus Sungiibacteriota bacterium TaxID=2750080 RepID=A0A932QXX0_9BACT|nr:inorganic phosphate transporter [Candidatus Sungbacteria bacterium]